MGHPGMMPAPVRLLDLTVTHDRHPAVHHLSGVFAPGSLTAIVGPNGAGKTTLLRALAGLHPVASGVIDLGGMPPGSIALLPQGGALDRSFPIHCLDVVALGGWGRAGPFRPVGAEGLARAAAALDAVGLRGFERRPVGALSAGQFQRVLFARLMMQDAPVLLLDEPFNAVDARTTSDLLALVAGWHAEGRTVAAVLHDIELARSHFPQALLLARHGLAWGASSDVLRPEQLRAARLSAEAWVDGAAPCRAAA